jgi:leucyl aminopeptidase
MDLSIKSVTQPENQKSQCLVVPVFAKGKLSATADLLDKTAKQLITTLCKRGDLTGGVAELLLLPHVEGIKAERLLLVGAGEQDKLTEQNFSKLANATINKLRGLNIKEACLLTEELNVIDQDSSWQFRKWAQLAELADYQYRETLSKPKAVSPLKKILIAGKADTANKKALAEGKAIGLGMNTTRELGNLPGNICTPSYLAKQAKALARKQKSLSTSIVEEKKMRELGMGSLLSVTAGTEQPAKLIVMNYQGGKKSDKPHVLVGKGITFDSGGISLKPGAKMDEMKYDMCGAAAVLGTMTAITELQPAINVVAIIAAAENLPSGKATKPGDVVTSMSGQTIEILNTDAEGRLVLCDALTYAEQFKPKSIIDIATLTGACVVALGKHATGLYSNQDDFAKELIAAGEAANDRAWHMPLWDEYQPQLDSNFADIANIGGPEAGSVTAACFLSRFTQKQRWAHLDIAGTAWISGANKGATGRPVALLTQYLLNQTAK